MKIPFQTLLAVAAQALLQVDRIDENKGYTMLQVGKVELFNTKNTVLHIIYPIQILNTITEIESNIEQIDVANKVILRKERRKY